MKCIFCGEHMDHVPIVKLTETGNTKQTGINWFCTKMDCKSEFDVRER